MASPTMDYLAPNTNSVEVKTPLQEKSVLCTSLLTHFENNQTYADTRNLRFKEFKVMFD